MPMLQQGQGKGRRSTKARGDAAEDAALDMLQARGLRLLVRNYRMPGRGAAEIDLVMQAADGTVVFVEVRQRSRIDHGGAGASIGAAKRARIVRAAQHYLLRWQRLPPVRFDVVLLEGTGPVWLPAAFDAA
ncbi:MAG: YraN family protein [Limnohabitans sp.]|nr:MAG: YraN family protein [Limnohabitans sp.]